MSRIGHDVYDAGEALQPKKSSCASCRPGSPKNASFLEPVLKPGSVDFRVLLSRFSIQNFGGIYTCRYCPQILKSKSGQNNPKRRRTPVLVQVLRDCLRTSILESIPDKECGSSDEPHCREYDSFCGLEERRSRGERSVALSRKVISKF